MATSTREKVKSSLEDLVGSGKPFLPSEVPTYRAIFQSGILLKQEHASGNAANRKYGIPKLCSDLSYEIITQWRKANPKFEPPITIKEKSLTNRLITKWKRITNVANGLASESTAETAISELDSLCDICVCSHEIVLCPNHGDCSGCVYKAHVKCDCPLDQKVPRLELYWLFHQRHKTSEKSGIQIAAADLRETKRQQNAKRRKESDAIGAEKRAKLADSYRDKINQSCNLDSDEDVEPSDTVPIIER